MKKYVKTPQESFAPINYERTCCWSHQLLVAALLTRACCAVKAAHGGMGRSSTTSILSALRGCSPPFESDQAALALPSASTGAVQQHGKCCLISEHRLWGWTWDAQPQPLVPSSLHVLQLKIVFHFCSFHPFKDNLHSFEAIVDGSSNLICISVTPLWAAAGGAWGL